MAASTASRVLGLIASALLVGLLIGPAPAWGESVALTRRSPAAADREASAALDALAKLGLQTSSASPAAAAALQLAVVETVIPPTDRPRPEGRRRHPAAQTPAAIQPQPAETETPALAVPEPATLVLGLTSTLILGSLSWKRRLVHPPRD